jgi:threonine synthase
MQYISTRGRAPKLEFDEVVLAGLASDGGLYVPEVMPQFSSDEIRAMRGLTYAELAIKIMLPFMGAGWSEARLKPLVNKAYAAFRHADIAPLVPLSGRHQVLELFHGPTLAFKDFALQFLGHLLGDILAKRKQRVTIIGATSGDTGSAAIAGCSGIDAVRMFILYPHGKVSDVQRRQMTTIHAPNVHALALEGNFDDCQNIVKALFADATFNKKHTLVAVNSINWARIMAQIVYYFYAALKLGTPEKPMVFSVPTGNFGDIFAGYLAKKMGLPIEKLIIASNANDILTRCWNTGTYAMQPVLQTLSPSMDIQISSNFERLLFDYSDRNGENIEALLAELKTKQNMTLPATWHARLKADFFAVASSDAQTTATMEAIYTSEQMLLDPHTATGVYAAEQYAALHPSDTPIVTLATAHPAKFPHAVHAATHVCPALPAHIKDLFDKREHFTVLPASKDAVVTFVEQH